MKSVSALAILALQVCAFAAEMRGPDLPWPEPDAKKVEALKKELRTDLDASFYITNVGPWVVATDLDAPSAQKFTNSTIAIYAAQIQRQLFTKKARSEPVKILLFKSADTYNEWNQKLYKELPNTPYGYYSRARNALVMNIGTGGGTLLHEMVHAMAEPDFPAIPAWLNEGLGSLFEQAATREKRIIGITNWRLGGLKKDLVANKATRFTDLIGMSDQEFYGERSGSNYASTRYLMQYLQEKGKLEVFYTRIRDKKDPDALTTLKFVFDNKKTVDEIEKDCYGWVRTLEFTR